MFKLKKKFKTNHEFNHVKAGNMELRVYKIPKKVLIPR